MLHPRLGGLLRAAGLALLLAACGSDRPSPLAAPGESAAATSAKGPQVALVSGGGQSGNPGQPLSSPIVVRVTDAGGTPAANQRVTFGAEGGVDVDPQATVTDAEGYARTVWTPGATLGTQSLTVDAGTRNVLRVTAGVQAGSGQRIALVKPLGDEQTGPAGSRLPAIVQATVVRDDGTLVKDAVVTFTASGGGAVAQVAQRSAGKGYTQVWWTLGPQGGDQILVATVPGAEPALFRATATGGIQQTVVDHVVVLRPDSLVLDVGGTGVFTAMLDVPGEPDLPGQALRWSSSDTAVAVVDARGTVRGVAPGTAVVTARLGVLTATARVRVRGRMPVTLQVVPDSLVLDAGASGTFTAVARDATGAPVPGTAPVWSSANPAVATVDAAGNVRGVAAGTVRVTATLGSLSASATVRVRSRGPSLELFPDSLVLDVGVWGQVYSVVRDASGQVLLNQRVEYSTSSDQVVYPFSDGGLFPIAAGTAVVTARWGDLTASVRVRVRVPRGGSLRIPQIQMRAGYAPKIEATTRDLETNWWIHVSQRNVSNLTMRLRGPQGRTIDCTNAGPESIYRDEFRCDLTLPRGSEGGVWRVDQVTVTKDGRTTTFTAADLEAMGTLGRAIDVFGAGTDTEPPQVRVLWPYQGGRYPDRYYVNFGVLDHVSGLRSARLTVRGPGGVTHSCEVGITAGGLCRLPLRPGSGTWDVVSVEAEDVAGNRATYTQQQIVQMASGMSEAPFLVYSFTP